MAQSRSLTVREGYINLTARYPMNEVSKKPFYGWVIVAVATLALVVSNGLSIGGIVAI